MNLIARGVLNIGYLLIACIVCAHALPTRADIFVVTSIGDSQSSGTLRWAIIQANANAGLDTIRFNIGGGGVRVISPASALPAITDPVILDGTTQPGYSSTPLIEINCTNAGPTAGLRLFCGGNTVRGLAINRGSAQAIYISGYGTNTIAGNFIGTDTSGTLNRGHMIEGIWVLNSSGNRIGGNEPADRNVISANAGPGLFIQGGAGNMVLGNRIGTSAGGTSALGNSHGIAIYLSSGNQIGSPTAGNIIAGNAGSGIYIKNSSGNVIHGNLVGLALGGATALPNQSDGITVQDSSGNILGGPDPGAGNFISGNNQSGVYLFGSSQDNQLQGNWIGTDVSGTVPLGNKLAGVTVAARNNMIGGFSVPTGNLISGNKQHGILLTAGSTGNLIAANVIGLDTDGRILSNAFNGINLQNAHSNTIGLSEGGGRNIISGNGYDGISFVSGSSNNIVQGNHIGTDALGTAARGNSRAGIGIDSPRNTIGGTDPGAGNLISGNFGPGVYLVGTTAKGNKLEGNRIGTDATGMLSLGNHDEGIYLRVASSNAIGSAGTGAGNLISGNGTWGISLDNASANTIQGNVIGTALDRVTPLGNSTRLGSSNNRFHTIELMNGASGNMIGGAIPSERNLVAYTPQHSGVYYAGIRIRDGSTNNALSGNSLFANAGLGIDLGSYLVTPNDACDADMGANLSQNFPVLAQAVRGSGTAVRGTLTSKPNTTFRIEFFTSDQCHALGAGEGKTFLGACEVTTDDSCSATFLASFPHPAPDGSVITATATDPRGNTSEFSACVPVGPVPNLSWMAMPGGMLQLSWPSDPSGFVLLQAETLGPEPVLWTPVTEGVINTGDGWTAIVPVAQGQKFFKLHLE